MRLPKGAWNTPEHQWPFKTALVRSMSLDVSLRKRQGVQRTTWARGVLRFVSGHPTPTIECPFQIRQTSSPLRFIAFK